MISLFSLNESGEKSSDKHILNPKKPALWIILASVVLIVTAAIIFLPNALKPPVVSEPSVGSQLSDASQAVDSESSAVESVGLNTSVSATVYELHMFFPDYAYISAIETNNDLFTEQIYKPIQMQEFSGGLGQRFHYESDLRDRFESYDESFFQDKCVFALILRSTKDKICLFDGVEYAQAVAAASTSSRPDLLVNISLTMAECSNGWVESNSWWLVLIELDPAASGHAPTDYKLGSVFSGIESATLTQQYETVVYNIEDGEAVDRYLVKRYPSGKNELCTGDGQPLLSGTDFYPMPHVIGVQSDGGWRLYDKTTLKPVSERVYEYLYCQQYPDDYWDPNHMTAKRNGYWVMLDCTGKELTDALYDAIYLNTYEEVWPIISVIQDGKYGAIDYTGKTVIPAQYDFLTMLVYTVEDTVFVRKDGKWGAITLDASLNTSEPNWAVQIPQELTENYALFECYSHGEDDLFTADPGFKILGSANGQITDQQMEVYASMHMQNYSYETGNTREEYDALTMKYFGKKLTDYTGGGMFEFIPGTDRIRAVGWSYDSSMFTMVKSLSNTDGKYYTGQYYCVNISDSAWDILDYSTVRQLIRDNNWAPLVEKGLTFDLREVKFTIRQEADGSYYPIYKSVQILQSGLKSPIANS